MRRRLVINSAFIALLLCGPVLFVVVPGTVHSAQREREADPLVGTRDSLSVEDTVRLVLERNPDLRAANAKIGQAQARLRASQSAYAPFVGFDMGYVRGDAPSAYLFKRIDARELPQMVDFNDPGVFGNVEAGLSLRYNLWDGGRKRSASRAARHSVQAQEQERLAVANELIGTTIQAYFDVLAAKEYVGVVQKSADTVAAQLEEVQVRHRHGGALRSDVLSIEVRRAEAEERLISARNGEALALSALRRLLDLPPEQSLTLSGKEWNPALLPSELAECLATAKMHRPEIAQLDEHLSAAQAGVSLSRSDKRPRLDMVGRYWADDDEGHFKGSRANWTIGAAVTWNLSDGGLNRAKQDEAKQTVAELEQRKKSLERAIELQVHQAFLNRKEAFERSKVARANVKRAEESLNLVKAQFEGGSATVTRFLQAEQGNTAALFRAIRGRFDVKKATAALGHTLGLCARCAKGWNKE